MRSTTRPRAWGQVALKNRRVEQSNFHNYRALRFADARPRVVVGQLDGHDPVVRLYKALGGGRQ